MEYLLLLSSIGLGAVCVFLFRLHEPRFVKLLNAFTGAYLLSLTLLHLLPELYHGHGVAETGAHSQDIRLGVLILAGFFVQIALDAVSMGVEHGHAHHLHGRMPFGIISGLCLHALIEATALGNKHEHHDLASRSLLLWSIVVHNFPVSIALLGMLLQTGMKRSSALWILALFAGMAPVGLFLSAHTNLAAYTRELTAVVIGIFMHISTTILFESSDEHRVKLAKLGAIVVGVALGFLSIALH